MKIVTINIPEQYLDCLKTLVDLGYFPSRSEAVRQALNQFLTKEANLVKEIEHDQFKVLKERQMNALIGSK
ncbi:ribbon-helix-helix domain-containing protein [Promethearchaeum syntrophicum]|uniref:Ribbon-helix-helix domain-containing protein n=1 Tax=Promethearchaeum syntrophicum TaxID=2594042 RepID=A0AC61ZTZ3_9ARCH